MAYNKAAISALTNKEKALEESGPESVVGIATGYGLEGLAIESRWGA